MRLMLNARTAALAAAVAALAIAGCGGDDDEDTAATQQQAVEQAATTPAQTQQQTQAETQEREREQEGSDDDGGSGTKVTPVSGETRTLKAGDLTMTVKVTEVAAPLETEFDEPQSGNQLVGVFYTAQLNRRGEPGEGVVAALKASDGESYGVRIISDGDCEGAPIPTEILGATKPTRDCIGFEIPRRAKPETFTLALTALKEKKRETQKATWDVG